MAEQEKEIITLEFDDGEEVECEIIGIFSTDGKDYLALAPEDETGDVYIYGYKEVSEDEFEIVDINDEAEYEKAAKECERILNPEK